MLIEEMTVFMKDFDWPIFMIEVLNESEHHIKFQIYKVTDWDKQNGVFVPTAVDEYVEVLANPKGIQMQFGSTNNENNHTGIVTNVTSKYDIECFNSVNLRIWETCVKKVPKLGEKKDGHISH